MNRSVPNALLRSLILSYLLSGVFLLLLSFILYKLELKEGSVNTAVYGIYGAAAAAGGFACGKMLHSRRFFWGLVIGLLYFLILLAVSFLLNRGAAPSLDGSMTALACCAVGGIAGGVIS